MPTPSKQVDSASAKVQPTSTSTPSNNLQDSANQSNSAAASAKIQPINTSTPTNNSLNSGNQGNSAAASTTATNPSWTKPPVPTQPTPTNALDPADYDFEPEVSESNFDNLINMCKRLKANVNKWDDKAKEACDKVTDYLTRTAISDMASDAVQLSIKVSLMIIGATLLGLIGAVAALGKSINISFSKDKNDSLPIALSDEDKKSNKPMNNDNKPVITFNDPKTQKDLPMITFSNQDGSPLNAQQTNEIQQKAKDIISDASNQAGVKLKNQIPIELEDQPSTSNSP